MQKKTFKASCFILISIFIITAVAGAGLYAKYITELRLDASVTFSVDLAERFELFEHKATRNSDGSYSLSEEEIHQNSFALMPGVDVPKDPTIRIIGKSSVDAYLYIELVASNIDNVSYSLTDEWKKIDGLSGLKGGTVYVYSKDDKAFVLNEGFTTELIPILKKDANGNTLTVSEKFDTTAMATTHLDFFAYMAQTEGNTKTAEQVFTDRFKTS